MSPIHSFGVASYTHTRSPIIAADKKARAPPIHPSTMKHQNRSPSTTWVQLRTSD